MLAELQSCKSIYDIATLLEIPAKTLAYLLYKLPNDKKYLDRCLSKKGGGTRAIRIPEHRLKELQSQLSAVLYVCVEELDKKYGKRRSYGFEKGIGIYENAIIHKNKRWVFNIDLENFFPSINFGRVISFFKNNSDFQLDPKIATIIAQIACHENQLPQGAPSSPVISNLICGGLDYRLSRLAKKARCDYSRYVDDITFSTNLKSFPEKIAVEDLSTQGWLIGTELQSRITSCGFNINPLKTRMSSRQSRQVVTGLVVNSKPAAKRELYKKSRAAIHHLMRGSKWHVHQFCEPFKLNCENESSDADPFDILEGRMSFIYQIDNKTDRRKDTTKFYHPSAIARSYSDLLFLKHFTNNNRPIILTEGLSDIIYIKAALQRLGAISNLSEIDKDGNVRYLFDFYRFSDHSSRLIGLSGGSGHLNIFMERLHHFQKRLSTNVVRRPLIVFLDNDDGLKGIDSTINRKFKIDISISKNEEFYKLSPRTFVVKTPHISNEKAKSCVEDFLDSAALIETINGKSFSLKNDYDPKTHFGKISLAKHVYHKNGNYTFSKFNYILTRLSSAIAAA